MRTFCAVLIAAAIAFAQHHEMKPAAEKPVVLYKGLGAWTHPITTKNPEAQRFFDQGLSLLYGFNRYEALRSFKKASELDPTAPMIWWGIAASQGPYINMDGDPSFDLKSACAAVDSGRKVAANAPERERAYLDAVAAWCPDYNPDKYIQAIKSVAQRWPDDLDAQTLYAESLMIPIRWRWYTKDGKPGGEILEAERTLEGVLRRWPEHSGANHYYIHAVESSPTPERSIPSAQRLMGVVPWAGHLVHMPGHIWLILGEFELAAGVNERAGALDREYMAATNIGVGSYTPYYIHNLHFIVYARWMQGNRAEAIKAADAITAAAGPMAEVMPEMADAFLTQTIFARVRTLAWDDLLKIPQPPEKFAATTTIWHYGRALAFLSRGDRTSAERERAAFEKMRKAVPPGAPWGQNKAVDVLALGAEVLAARMDGNPVAHWEKAVAMQDAFVYDEPPAWYYPVRESLGAALLKAGRAADAETVLREGLRKSPRNGFMLFALMESLKAQGQDTAQLKREFETVWAKSDIKLDLAAF